MERLKQHLTGLGAWSEAQQQAAETEALEQVRAAGREAEKVGVLGVTRPPVETMFDDVFKERPWHLDQQAAELLNGEGR